jgi:hypothetical protein
MVPVHGKDLLFAVSLLDIIYEVGLQHLRVELNESRLLRAAGSFLSELAPQELDLLGYVLGGCVVFFMSRSGFNVGRSLRLTHGGGSLRVIG